MTSSLTQPTAVHHSSDSSPEGGALPGALAIQRVRKGHVSGRWAIALGTLAAITLIMIPMGLGSLGLLYPHIFMSLLDGGFEQLSDAKQHYDEGDLPQAIEALEAIAPDSQAYADAQIALTQWRQEWQQLEQQLAAIEAAQVRSDWETVLSMAEQLPTTAFWSPQRTTWIERAQSALDQQGRSALQQAFNAAYRQDFVQALGNLYRISPRSSVYPQVPEKIAQYTHYRNVRAQYYLQQAFDAAQAQDFDLALTYLRRIDAASPAYAQAQQKIVEYTEKRDVRAQYFILRAANRATLQDYTGAILLLNQVSPDSAGFTNAQVRILAYGEQLSIATPKPEPSAPQPKAPPRQTPPPLPSGEMPPTTLTKSTSPEHGSMNAGDRLQETSPRYEPKSPE